jgi:hypothetical protein
MSDPGPGYCPGGSRSTRALCDGWSHSSAHCVMDGHTVPRTV